MYHYQHLARIVIRTALRKGIATQLWYPCDVEHFGYVITEPYTCPCCFRVKFLSVVIHFLEIATIRKLAAHVLSSRSLKSSILCNTHVARLTCHGVIPAAPPRSTCSGTCLSLLKANHQFELMGKGALHSRYALFNQKLSSSQLLGDILSIAV